MSEPYYTDDLVTLWHGDCLDVLATLPDESVHAVVTDPPYGLEFMGKGWDAPWQETGINTDAGFKGGGVSATKGAPSFTSSTNPNCLNCGGKQRGRRDGTALVAVCMCDAPRFPNTRAVEMRAFQDWCEAWSRECLRVLKPGGHMLAFGGTRTWHRLTVAIEDAGFEIRDSISWLYGSGFAKSWNFSTQYDGAWCDCESGKPVPLSHADDTDMRSLRNDLHPAAVARSEGEGADLFAPLQREAARGRVGQARAQGASGLDAGVRSGAPRAHDWRDEPGVARGVLHRAGQGVSDDPEAGAPEGSRERVRGGASASDGANDRPPRDATRGGASHQPRPGRQPAGEPGPLSGSHVALDDGALRGRPVCAWCGGLRPEYKGFGTAVKPAHEPIVVARKPLAGTVAANVLAHGTGAINVEACRVATTGRPLIVSKSEPSTGILGDGLNGSSAAGTTDAGRWPTNVILDESAAAELDRQSGVSRDGVAVNRNRGEVRPRTVAGVPSRVLHDDQGYGGEGGASRFFPTFRYEPKAPTAERPRDGSTAHPTVKPLDLMRWLVRLVTPPGGTVLEPFAGSGTTAEACVIEGFACIAIEREADYLPLIVQRLSKPIEPVLDLGEWTA